MICYGWSFAMPQWAASNEHHILKTRLYNFDPLKPHFYIVKLGFTGVYIIFLISVQNIDCGYSLEPPQWGSSNEYPQSMFWAESEAVLMSTHNLCFEQKHEKYQIFFIWNFSVFWRWNFLYIWIGVFLKWTTSIFENVCYGFSLEKHQYIFCWKCLIWSYFCVLE